MGPLTGTPLWVRVELEEMAMKEYFVHLRGSEEEPHHMDAILYLPTVVFEI